MPAVVRVNTRVVCPCAMCRKAKRPIHKGGLQYTVEYTHPAPRPKEPTRPSRVGIGTFRSGVEV